MLDGRSGNDNAGYSQGGSFNDSQSGGYSQAAPAQAAAAAAPAPVDELEDEIPF